MMLQDRPTQFWRVELGARVLIEALKMQGADPDCVLQLGLGCGCETKFLRAAFPAARFIAIDGLWRYCDEWRALYPGEIIWAAVNEKQHGGTIRYQDSRQRSKLLPAQSHSIDGGATFQTGWQGRHRPPAVTLDGLLGDGVVFGKKILLWADIEGGELAAFRGGKEFIKAVDYIWCEVNDVRPAEHAWWPTTEEIAAELLEQGFHLIFKAGMLQPREPSGDALFCRRGWRRRFLQQQAKEVSGKLT